MPTSQLTEHVSCFLQSLNLYEICVVFNMIISKIDSDNSDLFAEILEEYPKHIILIVVKKERFLQDIKLHNQQILCFKDEAYSKDISEKYDNQQIFFKESLNSKISVSTKNSFADKIKENLLKHTEPAINDAAKYASIVYNELDLDDEVEFIVISATNDYPDVMMVLCPAVPESPIKTQIKKILCYPKSL